MNRYVFVASIVALAIWSASSGATGEDTKGSSDKLRVACVGDSITYGARLTDRAKYSYPV